MLKIKISFVSLLFFLCTTGSNAQDPIYSPPWSNGQRRLPHLALSGSRTSFPASARGAYYRQQKDFSQHVLDMDSFRKDKRARIWKVNLRTRKRGAWVGRLVMANFICYALQVVNPRITQMGVKLSEKILSGQELYRLITPVFLHGNVLHLLMNTFSLQNVGPDVESLFGSGRFLGMYLGSGIAGNILSAINSPNPALGASGAIFGMIGAQLVFLNRNDWLLGRQGKRMEDAIIQTIGVNLFIGFMNPMVDNWGHLGGLVGGAIAAYYFGPRLFLLESPGGGKALVDSPIMRLPKSIESIPDEANKRYQNLSKRLNIGLKRPGLREKPWRDPRSNQ